jgi:hypothetical protein
MKRLWGHVVAGLSLLAGAGAVCFACVHDDSTIFIGNALASKFVTPGNQCIYTPDPTQTAISSGVLDVAVQQQYEGAFIVGNQLAPQVNTSQLQTETSTVIIQGAVVVIKDTKGNQIRTFTRLTSARITPSTGGVPGFEPVFVTIIDPIALQNSADIQANIIGATPGQSGSVRLVTYTRFFGRTLGGQSVESNEFEFPVDVCNGCLINFSNNGSSRFPNCIGNVGTGTAAAQPQIPCVPGQDLPIDCTIVCCSIPSCAMNTPDCSSGGVDAGSG